MKITSSFPHRSEADGRVRCLWAEETLLFQVPFPHYEDSPIPAAGLAGEHQ